MDIERTLAFLMTFPSGHARRCGPLLLMIQSEVRRRTWSADAGTDAATRKALLKALESAAGNDASLWFLFTTVHEEKIEAMYDTLCGEVDAKDGGKTLIPQARKFMEAQYIQRKQT